MNILIVDDAPEILAWLRLLLQRDGWNVFSAEDGIDACQILANQDIDVVVTDWMMPGMDGLNLIENIRGNQAEYIYVILMTALDREEDCIRGLSSGADDYLVKPVSPRVLNARLDVARRILSMQRELLEQQDRLRESRRMVAETLSGVRRDIKAAAKQQRVSLPSALAMPDGVSADWRYRAAKDLSGDHFDFFLLGENKLAFYLLDVSGHGVGSALRSSALREMLRPYSNIMSDIASVGPHTALEKLNQHLCAAGSELDYLATLVLGVMNTETGKFCISSAGHPCPVIVGPDGFLQDIATSGLPLGVVPNAAFECHQAQLMPGQTVLLYSDGVPDCRNGGGEDFGHENLRRVAQSAGGSGPRDLVAGLEQAIDAWRIGEPLTDDLSVLAIGLSMRATLTVVPENNWRACGATA